jgi:hypothetical protein
VLVEKQKNENRMSNFSSKLVKVGGYALLHLWWLWNSRLLFKRPLADTEFDLPGTESLGLLRIAFRSYSTAIYSGVWLQEVASDGMKLCKTELCSTGREFKLASVMDEAKWCIVSEWVLSRLITQDV